MGIHAKLAVSDDKAGSVEPIKFLRVKKTWFGLGKKVVQVERQSNGKVYMLPWDLFPAIRTTKCRSSLRKSVLSVIHLDYYEVDAPKHILDSIPDRIMLEGVG